MTNFMVKKHSKATPRVVHKCKLCDKVIHSFYLMREDRWKEHGAQRGSEAQNVYVTQLTGDVDDNSLKGELETFKHFLVDNEMEKGKQKVFNFVMDILEPKNLSEKLDVVLDSPKCAAKLNVAISFALKNVEDWSCRCF